MFIRDISINGLSRRAIYRGEESEDPPSKDWLASYTEIPNRGFRVWDVLAWSRYTMRATEQEAHDEMIRRAMLTRMTK